MYYLDSSAFVKAYLREPGSAFVDRLLAAEEVAASSLSVVEVASAIGRRMRDLGELERGVELFRAFIADVRRAHLIEVVQPILLSASNLLLHNEWALRSLDAIHLASALHLARTRTPAAFDAFVSSDLRLLDAASSAGLRVLNPEAADQQPETP